MDNLHYKELVEKLNTLDKAGILQEKHIYLFGHCNATEALADLLLARDYKVCAILDNNVSKHGEAYKNIRIIPPANILEEDMEYTLICIAARAYAAMVKQLQQLGFKGRIEKMVDYNSYAEYSLSDETIKEKQQRLKRGLALLAEDRQKYPDTFRLYCPFQALGDVYYMMSYLPYYLEKKKISRYVVFTIGQACAEVAKLFDAKYVEPLTQREMDEQIQAVLYTNDSGAYVPHQDRPYVANVYKALYIKKIPLEMIYKCGVFGLRPDCRPYKPTKWRTYEKLETIPEKKAVVLSPHAKSVANIPEAYWAEIVSYFTQKDYTIYTNVVGEEKELEHTIRLETALAEFQSVVERAGTFIGLRSGLCDVIKWANCRKIALYPDAFYSDTKWKMEAIYHLDGWENIVVPKLG